MSAPTPEPTFLSTPLLALLATIAFGLAAIAPLYFLVLFDLTLVPILDFWVLGGIRIDPSDLILGCLAFGLVARARFSPIDLVRKLPYFLPWLALGTFITLSYVYSPVNADNLTDPVRVAYQVYRYCWKPLLYFPICLLVLRELRQARHAWMAILIGGGICAGQTVQQGYSGESVPSGPFETGNMLAAVLVVPMIVAFSGMVFPTSRYHWLFSTASSVLIARAVLFSGSRGGMAAVMAGAAFLGFFAFWSSAGRSRILKLVPLTIVGGLALIAVRPDILDRPTVKHAFTLFEGTRTANMQWRMVQRWPHFLQIAVDNPVLGTGTYVDETLSDDANTPHNGYLALAVKHGFPVLALFLFFMLRLTFDCLSAFRRTKTFEDGIFYLTLAAAVLGLATHNIVDTTLTNNIILKYFWMFCALGAAYHRLWQPAAARVERKVVPRPDPSLAPAG